MHFCYGIDYAGFIGSGINDKEVNSSFGFIMGYDKVTLSFMYVFYKLGVGLSPTWSTCTNLHLILFSYFYYEDCESCSKLNQALINTGFKSFMLFNVFGFVFLILASSSYETAGILYA